MQMTHCGMSPQGNNVTGGAAKDDIVPEIQAGSMMKTHAKINLVLYALYVIKLLKISISIYSCCPTHHICKIWITPNTSCTIVVWLAAQSVSDVIAFAASIIPQYILSPLSSDLQRNHCLMLLHLLRLLSCDLQRNHCLMLLHLLPVSSPNTHCGCCHVTCSSVTVGCNCICCM